MRLSRDDILKAEDITTEEVDVPEWGGTVLVRGMTGQQRDEFEASTAVRRGNQMVQDYANVRAKVVAWCVVNDDGTRMFTASDVHALGEKSGAALDRIFWVASRLSGLSEEDVQSLEGELAGNPTGGSSSSSPSPSGSPSGISSPPPTATS